jgi:group II intron reverse transcriptase/maturase
MSKLGTQGAPLTRVYRSLFNIELLKDAYDIISHNKGATTPGVDEEDTADGMSLEKLHNVIEALRNERFWFKPVKRVYTPKANGKKRPLGLPGFSDKLVQQAIKMILEPYYEKIFRESSHGFRPQRGCHTALWSIKQRMKGAVWFIEGDIKGCFDNIDHEVLLNLLKKRIRDGRLLELIRRFLNAGYMEDWTYHQTYSGTPQGGVLSPLLANIYLHELDEFIEEEVIPRYTRGEWRRANPQYTRCIRQINEAKSNGNRDEMRRLRQERSQVPAKDPNDPDYRRLTYCRYADDFILGVRGHIE